MSASSEILEGEQIVSDSSSAKKINNALITSKTKLEGLQSLSLFLAECSDEDFLQFCTSWMQNCCKIDGPEKNIDFAARVLDDLFKISSNYQELKKSVSFFITTRYFDFFFKYFLNSQSGWSCTKTCLSLYRGACGPFQEKLEKHLRNELKRKVRISSTLAGCFALIPSIGGGGNEGLLYKENWKAQFERFLIDSHSILNVLYADVEDLQEYRSSEKSGTERDIEFLVIQLYNHSVVLNSMLLNEYPTAKSIPTDQIFELICRGLAINPKSLSKRQTTAVMALHKVLPEVHRILLSFLKAVIVTCKNQLLPYSYLICKLIKQSLEWTASEFNSGCEKPFGSLRITIYETLCNWLAVARNGSCVETVSRIVVSNAVSDIESKKGVLCLKEKKGQKQSISKETTRRINPTANSKLCYAALKALQFLLKFVGVSLKSEEQKFLQEFVVKLITEVQKSSNFDVVAPFSVPYCRLGLYSLLVDFVHQPCPKWPPPTNFALRLLSNGIKDRCLEVSTFCSSAVNLITTIVHPQYDNGEFPSVEIPEDHPRTEVELQWREEPMEVNEKENENFREETTEIQESFNSGEEAIDVEENSNISSDEDSRNTIKFLTDVQKSETPSREATPEESSPISTEEPNAKKLKPAEEPEMEKMPSLKEGPPLENVSVEARAEDEKVVTPESTNEDGLPKTRYFLRSARKGSSEEPEEAVKTTNSPEASRNTPSKSLGRATPLTGKKRPRTRALSKFEKNDEIEYKIPEKNSQEENEEDDIKASFHDSFVD